MKPSTILKVTGTATAIAGASVTALYTTSGQIAKSLIYRYQKDEVDHSMLLEKYQGEIVSLVNDMNIKQRGVLIEKPENKKTLFILHPLALDSSDMILYVDFFQRKIPDANILLIDASAHGISDGYIRGFGIRDVHDLVAWNRFVLERYGMEHQMILYGKEMGANTILNTVSLHRLQNIKAVICDGAYTSFSDLLKHRILNDYRLPVFPVYQFVAKKIKRVANIEINESTVDLVKHNDVPTLYFHARHDEFVPLDHVYPLYNANRGHKALFVLKDEHYLYDLKETDEYHETLKEFISKL
ncbi:MAG: alpha/beta hydrolase [Erysipelotrichaceae bacterium]|nr:alpha/beta hydrolase [Erysipelotrichaceae bacterium]MDD3809909.1 alpha/beta hydrolase [Erysipelotrichaceae bacterium]